MRKVVLYCKNSPLCNEARRFLKFHGVVFDEVDVSTPQGNQLLTKRTQQKAIPAFEIRGSHSVHVIIGIDKLLLEHELRLTKGTQKKLDLQE